MRVARQIKNMMWVLVNRCGKSQDEVSRLFGRSKNWTCEFMNRKEHKQLTITQDMIKCMNRLGYDIRVVKIEIPRRKEGHDEEARVEETATAG